MMVCPRASALRSADKGALVRTVLPEPLRPTIRVSGFGNVMTPPCSGLKLRIPLMRSLRSAAGARCQHTSHVHVKRTQRARGVAWPARAHARATPGRRPGGSNAPPRAPESCGGCAGTVARLRCAPVHGGHPAAVVNRRVARGPGAEPPAQAAGNTPRSATECGKCPSLARARSCARAVCRRRASVAGTAGQHTRAALLGASTLLATLLAAPRARPCSACARAGRVLAMVRARAAAASPLPSDLFARAALHARSSACSEAAAPSTRASARTPSPSSTRCENQAAL